MKDFFGLLAVLLSVAATIPYIYDIYKGKTKPHLYTFIIWTIVTALVFLGQYAAGAGPGAWATGVSAVLTAVILVLSFKYGTDDVTKFDAVLLVCALAAIIVWWFTKDPTVSVAIATLIDVCAFAPTIRKTLNDPTSETLLAWVANILRHGFTLCALSNFVLATYLYPTALLFMNALVIFVILFRPKKIINFG